VVHWALADGKGQEGEAVAVVLDKVPEGKGFRAVQSCRSNLLKVSFSNDVKLMMIPFYQKSKCLYGDFQICYVILGLLKVTGKRS
jgi:hypothetical protein